jgi:15-cis-phytoene synthase
MSELSRAFEFCRDVCRKRARNFYYGLKISPEPERSALYTLYAWMRQADDLADDAHSGHRDEKVRQIVQFRRDTDAALLGRPQHSNPLWIALAETTTRYQLPSEPFHDTLDGQLDDLNRVEYATFADLERYCRRVASTVGLLCIEIWGYHDPRAPQLAIDRGIAFQLTNILRDYKQDYDGGRVYVPRDELAQFELSARELRKWSKPVACRNFMDFQIERAARYYNHSANLDEMIAERNRATMWAMTEIYRQLLRRIANDPSRVMRERRVRLSAFRKASIAMRAKWRARNALLSSTSELKPVRARQRVSEPSITP